MSYIGETGGKLKEAVVGYQFSVLKTHNSSNAADNRDMNRWMTTLSAGDEERVELIDALAAHMQDCDAADLAVCRRLLQHLKEFYPPALRLC